MAEIVAGSHKLNKKLMALMAQVEPSQRQVALMQGGFVIEAYAKDNVRSQHLIDTGNLRASITTEPDGDEAVTVGPRNVVYAAIHEFGGTITAKNAPYLRFKTADGAWHSVKSVTIPARPYMRPALDEHKKTVNAAVAATLLRFIQQAAK